MKHSERLKRIEKDIMYMTKEELVHLQMEIEIELIERKEAPQK